ncbi:hypothetical protein EDD18DRAFT_1110109 [Armillaria luteobubalina]|uniref:Uncharacterized protein n=1 Tax=Armillaria luteobubalina TaxID=153913 RepID=A0AA39UMR4_9AGAR|nr:hypothetical protein EDD18DRAFT_1110109 [Armillaria luteobubalina]
MLKPASSSSHIKLSTKAAPACCCTQINLLTSPSKAQTGNQEAQGFPQENKEIEESDLVSGDKDKFELDFGDEGEIAEGKIGNGEDEGEGEGEGERISNDNDNEKDGEIGQKGYDTRQNWVLSVCHSLGKLVPHVISLFTPVDDIMWTGAKLLNKALKFLGAQCNNVGDYHVFLETQLA